MISLRRDTEKFIMAGHQGVILRLVLGLLIAGWVSSVGVLASARGIMDEEHAVSTVAQPDDESAPADSQVVDEFDDLPMNMNNTGSL